MAGVVATIPVTENSHGFNGILGLGAGHPLLMGIPKTVPQPEKEDEDDQDSLLSYLEVQARLGSSLTPKELLAIWMAKKKPVAEVSVEETSNTSSDSSMSSVSTASPTASPEATPTTAIPPTPGLPTPVSPPTTSPTATAVTTEAPSTPKRVPKKTPPKVTKTTTPPPKKRSLDDLSPGMKSPQRMANGLHAYGCDHGSGVKDFVGYDKCYFTKKYCSQANYPNLCSGCDGVLVRGKGDSAQKLVKISGIFLVRCCRNAINHRDHPCTYALCHSCWAEKCEERRSPKKQRSNTILVLPGEKLNGDGTISAGNRR